MCPCVPGYLGTCHVALSIDEETKNHPEGTELMPLLFTGQQGHVNHKLSAQCKASECPFAQTLTSPLCELKKSEVNVPFEREECIIKGHNSKSNLTQSLSAGLSGFLLTWIEVMGTLVFGFHMCDKTATSPSQKPEI